MLEYEQWTHTKHEKVSTSQISHMGVTFYTRNNKTVTYKKRPAPRIPTKELACTLSHIKKTATTGIR